MFRFAIATALAVGMGMAGVNTGQAAAVPTAAGVQALVPIDALTLAQYKPVVRAAPRGAVGRPVVVAPRRGVVVGGPRVVGRPAVVGVRPAYVRAYRPIVRRPWFGLAVAGVTLGAIATVATVGAAPAAPAPGLCWYWVDPSLTTGYWGYC